MSVRWTDEQLKVFEKFVGEIKKFRIHLDTSGITDKMLDAFTVDGGMLPPDLVKNSSEMYYGMSKLEAMLEFQRMIRENNV